MRECEAMIEPQSHKREVTVTFPRFETPYFVKVDRTRVKQVLINLLSNAIKYNKLNGKVMVTCSTPAINRLRISVEDTGEGLSPEKIAQLFQPFNRLGQENYDQEGTGIGLVMTKRLIELMGGQIGLESTLGKGSTFWVEMNLTDKRIPSIEADATPIPKTVTTPDSSLYTLLYVEDNPANLMLVEDLIERRPDIRLLSARDGISGVDLARTALPDVILMDINLPGISGVNALKLLSRDAATAHIPIIALSANAIPTDIAKGLEAGFFRYLTKPIKVTEFMDTLDIALKFVDAPKTPLNAEDIT
jgi:CheY-like chemotaxis protein